MDSILGLVIVAIFYGLKSNLLYPMNTKDPKNKVTADENNFAMILKS